MASTAEMARTYSRTQLETATHPRIIAMMHAKCVQLLRRAMASSSQERRLLLVRTQNLLAELEGSLKITDHISKALFYLYDYCYCLLESDRPESHALALAHLATLSDTFRTLLKKRT